MGWVCPGGPYYREGWGGWGAERGSGVEREAHSGTHRPTLVQHLPSHLRPLNLSEPQFPASERGVVELCRAMGKTH